MKFRDEHHSYYSHVELWRDMQYRNYHDISNVDDATLWRFMPFSQFCDLVLNKRIWFPSLNALHSIDPAEGRFEPQFPWEIFTQQVAYFEDESSFIVDGAATDMKIAAFSSNIRRFCQNCYVSCWHKKPDETFLMWQSYGRMENPVAIKTSLHKLLNATMLIDWIKNQSPRTFIGDVRYGDEQLSYMKAIFRDSYPAFLKRKFFFEESEFRVAIQLNHHFDLEKINGMTSVPGYDFDTHLKTSLSEMSDRKEWGKPEYPSGLYVDTDPLMLIDEVVTSPSVVGWQFDMIKSFLRLTEFDSGVLRKSQISETINPFLEIKKALHHQGITLNKYAFEPPESKY